MTSHGLGFSAVCCGCVPICGDLLVDSADLYLWPANSSPAGAERAAQNQTAGRQQALEAFRQTHNRQSTCEELGCISRMPVGRRIPISESHAEYRCPSTC